MKRRREKGEERRKEEIVEKNTQKNQKGKISKFEKIKGHFTPEFGSLKILISVQKGTR
jgi:hypothetical protein